MRTPPVSLNVAPARHRPLESASTKAKSVAPDTFAQPVVGQGMPALTPAERASYIRAQMQMEDA